MLLEVPSIQKLVQYFQGMYASDEVYELKGVHVTTYDINEIVSSDSEAANCSWKQCGALGLYAICYSLIITAPFPFSKAQVKVTTASCWYLISRFWRDSISQGFRFAISIGKYTMAYKGHAANIKETTQIKKKTRKQKRKHANKKENTQIKKKPRKQKRNHANKKENREPTPRVILVPRALADF